MRPSACKTNDPQVQNWVLSVLLPWVYWHQQADKTRHRELKAGYLEAAHRAQTQVIEHPLTQTLGLAHVQEWIEWAQWMCNKYQRTSSAVEGRNGYLSALHHNGRGFDEQTLQVLTIIHNFDLNREDGTTAAQRLFGHQFPDLFEWVVEHMGELPVARQSAKVKQANPLTLAIFPA